MGISDRHYRHYSCDAPLCTCEADSEHELLASEAFRTFRIDFGHYDRVLTATFCEEHAAKFLDHVKLLGCEERLR